VIFIVFAGLINLAVGVMHLCENDYLNEAGLLTFRILNLVVAVMMAVILVALLIKVWLDKKAETV